MSSSSVTKATLGRVPHYLKFLKELPDDWFEYISATHIARELELGEVQVRKDLNAISGEGKPKLGYVTEELIQKLEDRLGCNRMTFAVLNPCRKDISRFVTMKIPNAMNAVVAMDLRLMESIISSSSFSSVITITKMPRKKRRYITIDMNLVCV